MQRLLFMVFILTGVIASSRDIPSKISAAESKSTNLLNHDSIFKIISRSLKIHEPLAYWDLIWYDVCGNCWYKIKPNTHVSLSWQTFSWFVFKILQKGEYRIKTKIKLQINKITEYKNRGSSESQQWSQMESPSLIRFTLTDYKFNELYRPQTWWVQRPKNNRPINSWDHQELIGGLGGTMIKLWYSVWIDQKISWSQPESKDRTFKSPYHMPSAGNRSYHVWHYRNHFRQCKFGFVYWLQW